MNHPAEEIDVRIEINGKPYLLEETEGGFYVAKAVLVDRDGWWFERNNDIGKLVLGINITETPMDKIQLLVNTSSCADYDDNLRRIIDTLRQFAQVSGHDYVGYVSWQNSMERPVVPDNGNLYEVIPRLFKEHRSNLFLGS